MVFLENFFSILLHVPILAMILFVVYLNIKCLYQIFHADVNNTST